MLLVKIFNIFDEKKKKIICDIETKLKKNQAYDGNYQKKSSSAIILLFKVLTLLDIQ